MTDLDVQPSVDDDRRIARRSMIKKSAAATAAAWAGSMVIDGITNPAAAATCTAGSYSLIYISSTSGTVTNRTTQGSIPSAAISYGIVSGTTYGTTFSSGAFYHVASATGNTGAITVSLGASCANCYIESVYAAIHLRGVGCCPYPYYAAAGATGKISVTPSPGPGVTSISMTPWSTVATSACGSANYVANSESGDPNAPLNAALHWGAPTSPGCATTLGADYANGWVVINVKCV